MVNTVMRNRLLLVFLIMGVMSEQTVLCRSKIHSIYISKDDLDKALTKNLNNYLDLAVYFPRSFFSFEILYPNTSDLPKFIYRDWKNGSKSFMGKKYKKLLKRKIAEIWKYKEEGTRLEKPLEKLETTLAFLNGRAKVLRNFYDDFRNKYDHDLLRLLDNKYDSRSHFNTQLKSNEYDFNNLALLYKDNFLRHSLQFPYRLLRTKYMIDLIEGGHYKIEAIDLYNAVAQQKNRYLANFMSEITEVSSHCEVKQEECIELTIKGDHKFQELQAPAIPGLQRLMPSIESDHYFRLLQKYHKKDVELAILIGHGYLQKAVWRLRTYGFEKVASELESAIYYEYMHPEAVHSFEPLGGGISKSFKVFFHSGLSGVFKPKAVINLRPGNSNLFAYIAAGHKNEVAAFHMDRLLDLNMVPITKIYSPQSKRVGSLQFFVKDAYNARKLTAINPKFPIKNGKLSKPKGRTKLSGDILLFDWIIDNVDRNLDNYLIQFDGQVVLIDHGFSFVTSFYFDPSDKMLNKMRPSKKIAKKIIHLKSNPMLVQQAISHLVGIDVANAVQKRIDFIGNYLESNSKANPSHKETVEASCGA